MITMLVIYITESDSFLSQLSHYNGFVLLVTDIIVPGCFADEKVLSHYVVLIVVTLSEEVLLGLEVGRNDAADASASIGYVLSFLVFFHDVCNLGTYIS